MSTDPASYGAPMTEVWRAVVGFEDLYQVSSRGRVRTLHGGRVRILKPWITPDGYLTVDLHRSGQRKHGRVHVLVATAWYGPCPEGNVCRHLNGDPMDNGLENLAWGTFSENSHDTVRHGRHHQVAKTQCHRGHEYDEANTGRRKDRGGTGRYCRTCLRENSRRLYWAKKESA